MLHLQTCLLLLLGLETTLALVVDGPSIRQQEIRPCSETIALIHDPREQIGSGILLPRGPYVLTTAHVTESSSRANIGGASILPGIVALWPPTVDCTDHLESWESQLMSRHSCRGSSRFSPSHGKHRSTETGTHHRIKI